VYQISEDQAESSQNLAPLDRTDNINMTDLHVDTTFVLSEVALNKTSNPLTLVSKILIGSLTLYALWDSGSSITAVVFRLLSRSLFYTSDLILLHLLHLVLP
jgi:hypothetical protein